MKHFPELGERFFEVFDYDRRSNHISTQIRNLQQITCSATRFADIEDFVKNQMGKKMGKEAKWRELGDKVLGTVEDVASSKVNNSITIPSTRWLCVCASPVAGSVPWSVNTSIG